MADKSHGVTIGYETTPASGTYTEINGLLGFNGPNPTDEWVDTTDHQSTAVEGFTTGIIDNGELSFDVNWEEDDATHIFLLTELEAGTTREYQIAYTDGGSSLDTFDGYVLSISRGHPVRNKVTASIVIRIDGAVVHS